ncbi:unnamed protein product [Fraxinus pennsylvanica]|uniref:Uncharacterized protein n=1 Tax=Fraxinus pennsylvanica TaxID=56036 RepID=A0AAD2ABH1_9LAMI|nr:unnamed protein product [Fraxinus pennsylvanica]
MSKSTLGRGEVTMGMKSGSSLFLSNVLIRIGSPRIKTYTKRSKFSCICRRKTPASKNIGKASNYHKFEELYRSIANKFNWHSPESNKGWLNEREQRFPAYNGIDRSYSVTFGKIGPIDEDEPCDFHEHVIMKSEILMPRSRSHAVTRGNMYY